MDLNLVSVADLVSAAGFTVALAVVLATPVRRDHVFGQTTRWGLLACLSVYALVGFSNALEHGGISSVLDATYEDYIEVLFSPMLLYFYYAVFSRIELRRRERAERFLRDELDMLGTVVDVCPVAIVVTDAAGMLAFANQPAEELLGLAASDIGAPPCEGCGWRRLDEPQEGAAPWLAVAAAASSLKGTPYVFRDAEGRERSLSVNATPVLGADGVVTGVVVALERTEAAAQAV